MIQLRGGEQRLARVAGRNEDGRRAEQDAPCESPPSCLDFPAGEQRSPPWARPPRNRTVSSRLSALWCRLCHPSAGTISPSMGQTHRHWTWTRRGTIASSAPIDNRILPPPDRKSPNRKSPDNPIPRQTDYPTIKQVICRAEPQVCDGRTTLLRGRSCCMASGPVLN